MRTSRILGRTRLGGLLLALTLALPLALAGCGDEEAGTAKDLGDHNQADVTFATHMIQHHAQALALVDLTHGRGYLDGEVQLLAERILLAQGPEIETMTDWLTEWDEEIPETVRDHANHHSEEMPEMPDLPGMLSAEEMEALEAAPIEEFQARWLEAMVEHHEGAVAMARTEQEEGKYPPAIELAEQIEANQSAEIEEMQALLG